jgi:parallel beta-helix repeat protein
MVATNTLTETPRHLTAQEPGPRLEPEEFTNHVPIYINGTDDFEAQNWPGSGTDVDPYVISGLNITYGIGQTLIEIENTEAHFVIRDCFLNQLSSIWAMNLYNVSHGTVEYSHIESQWGGVFLTRANNTLLDHVHVLSGDAFAVELDISTDCSVIHSLINSTGYWSVLAILAHQLLIEDTVSQCHTTGYNLYLLSSNHTTIENTELIHGVWGVVAASCHWLTVTGVSLESPQAGLNIAVCPQSLLADVKGTVSSGRVLDMAASEHTTIEDFEFLEAGVGMRIVSSNDTLVTRCSLANGNSEGIYIQESHRCNVTDNRISTCDDGFYGFLSDDLVLTGNEIEDVLDQGIVTEGCNRIAVESNSIYDTGYRGIGIYVSENSTCSSNTVDLTEEEGIYVESAPNLAMEYNAVSNTDAAGIRLDICANALFRENTILSTWDEGLSASNCPDIQVLDNTVSESSETGLYLTDTPRALIMGNEIAECDDGIYFEGPNVTVVENTLTDLDWTGIEAWSPINAIITNNTIDSRCYYEGIGVEYAQNLTIAGNELIDCGIYLGGQPAIIYVNHTIYGNTVNGKPYGYLLNQSNQILAGDDYGQIAMIECENITITGGFFEYCYVPIAIYTGEHIHIEDMESAGNFRGCMAIGVEDLTILSAHLEGVDNGFGLSLAACEEVHIEDSTFRKFDVNGYGIYSLMTPNVTLLLSTLEYNDRGLLLEDSDDAEVIGCEFLHNEYAGIYALDSADWATVEDCHFLNSSMGIYVDNSDYWNITGCEVRHCTSGIYIAGSSADYNNVTACVTESCGYGIRINNGDYATIRNNTVRWCTTYGIYMRFSDFTEVYYNTIAFNDINAYDNRLNTWDDGVSEGNWWSDYSPPPPYSITAGGGGSVDNYPNVYAPIEPVIDQPIDLYYAEGSTGNEIVWNPKDDELRDWTVDIDGEFWDSDAWDFVDITVNVDGLAYGTHTLVITVYDVDQNSVTDEVIIHVYDDTPPTLDSPSDEIAFEAATGQTITWTASDLNPGDYAVHLDGEMDADGTWTDEVTYNIDALSVGIHEVVLRIYDLDGNSDSDTVMVEVISDDTAPTIDSPSDLTLYEGSTGGKIVWTPSDEWPAEYEIESNGSVVTSGTWAGSRIIYSLDGLSLGTYSFELTVYDGSGNSASDSVTITILDVPEAEEDLAPVDPMMLLLIVGGIGGIIVIVAVAYFLKKRRG